MDVTWSLPGSFQPAEWFLAFFERTNVAWLNRLPFVRFRHISAFAYVPGTKAWIWYDSHWFGTSLVIIGHERFTTEVAKLTHGATVVKLAKRPEAPMPLSTRVGFYCVPCVKHLVGVRCAAITPDGFYLAVIRAGGTIIGRQSPTATDRSPASAGAAAGAD
jgi:hypothetical protein